MYCNVCNKYRKFKKTKICIFFKKKYVFLLLTVNVVKNMEKHLKNQNHQVLIELVI